MTSTQQIPLSQTRTHGDLVYVSGQLGADPETGTIPEGFASEVRHALDSLRHQLESAGASLDSVLKTTVFIRHERDFGQMNAIYAEYFKEPYPARSTIVTTLARPEARFEIEATAHLRQAVNHGRR